MTLLTEIEMQAIRDDIIFPALRDNMQCEPGTARHAGCERAECICALLANRMAHQIAAWEPGR